MPVSCAASGCKSRYTLEAREKGITFHRFPKSNPALLDKWRRAMKRATSTGELWMPSRYQRLCSLHFQQSCFDTTGQTKRLRDDVIPSIFNFPDESQDHPYFIPDIETLKRKLQASEDSRVQKEKELRNAKDREKRLRQTCCSVYQELRKRNLLCVQLEESLQPYQDIALELFKKPDLEYSAQQRLFSLTLYLYGPLSYKYLRKEMKLPLPGSKRLHQWLKSDCKGPGINSTVIEALLEKKQAQPYLYSRACIVMDTIPVQQNVVFDSQRNEFVGLVNLGAGGTGSAAQEVANEVLVFMLVGTTGHWKVPVAYFFVKLLTAEAQKQLISHVLYELSENGFEVVAVSMERSPRNEDMCTLLGCTFTDPWNPQTFFSLPSNDFKHYVIFDMCYELKTVNNIVEELGSLLGPDGTISWQYIDELMNIPRSARKFPQLAKMPLLANKLSNTVADAVKLIQEVKCQEIDYSQATVNFIQIIDQLFDIFNSSSMRLQGNKGSVSYFNLEEKLQILQGTREYLLTLMTNDGDFLFQTSRGWSINGLLVNIVSLSVLLPWLLTEQEYVTTHRFSTHYLKKFFSSLWTKGKSKASPTAFQVRCAIENLLSQSRFIDTDFNSEVVFGDTSMDQSLCGYRQNISSPFADTSIELPDHIYSSNSLSMAVNNSEMYIAGWVVRKAFSQLSCNKCRWALVTEQHPTDFTNAYHLLQVKGGTVYYVPSNGTIRTVQIVDKEVNRMLNHGNSKYSISVFMLQHRTLLALGSADIFNLKDHIAQTELGMDNHHFQLVRFITSLFYELRKSYIHKTTVANQQRALAKQTLARL
uniref:THAP-type domain-containing protein n=1 Tax=Pyxicephalus adspersus TaxID=30357 RepID=A0AAV3AIU5_PYXAD|nr:TPA: hypothetical protein GDO54_007240 [Pyxicephalus adspersus]